MKYEDEFYPPLAPNEKNQTEERKARDLEAFKKAEKETINSTKKE